MQYRVRTVLMAIVSMALVLTLTQDLDPKWQGAAAAGLGSLWIGIAVVLWAIDLFYRKPFVSTLALLAGILLAALGADLTIFSVALALMFWFGYHVPA